MFNEEAAIHIYIFIIIIEFTSPPGKSRLAAGPVTVAGRLGEVPPSGLPHSDLARARVRTGGGKDYRVRMLATRVRSPTKLILDLT